MIGKLSVGKQLNDSVFKVTARAKEAIKNHGIDNVVNATIGALYGEDEKLANIKVVGDTYRTLSNEDIFAYAPQIDGSNDFKLGIKKLVLGRAFEETFKNNYIGVIGTAGGTGAIKNSFKNYLNPNEKVLLPHLMWGSYKVIANEVGAGFTTYKLFNEEGNFNLEDFKAQVSELAKIQENIVILINDPCHNPTGYSLSIPEWKEILKFLNKVSEEKDVILLNDIAYGDFAIRDVQEYRELFTNLNEKLLVIFLYSMSKSFTAYGLRGGAQVAISKSKDVIDEFIRVNQYSCRASWSNIPRGAMSLISAIVNDSEKYEKLLDERKYLSDLLAERASIFIEEAKEMDLVTYPYRDGFFVTIPVTDIEKTVENLEKENIFVVPLVNEIRVGLCSVPVKKVYGLAEKIKNCIR